LPEHNIKTLFVPQYKGLTVEDFITYAAANMEVMKYLPNEKDMYLLPRDYLINVIHSILGDTFR
jgi:hypothetical protein